MPGKQIKAAKKAAAGKKKEESKKKKHHSKTKPVAKHTSASGVGGGGNVKKVSRLCICFLFFCCNILVAYIRASIFAISKPWIQKASKSHTNVTIMDGLFCLNSSRMNPKQNRRATTICWEKRWRRRRSNTDMTFVIITTINPSPRQNHTLFQPPRMLTNQIIHIELIKWTIFDKLL